MECSILKNKLQTPLPSSWLIKADEVRVLEYLIQKLFFGVGILHDD